MRFVRSITSIFKPSPLNESEIPKKQAALYNSEVFFNNRMSISFPGIRGLKLISIGINTLEGFFKEPISNSDVAPVMIIDQFGSHPIKQFKVLNNDSKTFLIGDTEVLSHNSHLHNDLSWVFVYRHPENPSFQFLCINGCSQNQVKFNNCYFLNQCGISLYDKDVNNIKYHHVGLQEYVIFYENNQPQCNITKELYDDISISNDYKCFSQCGRFEFRRRYLCDSKLMIVPTDSVFDQKVYKDIIDILYRYPCFDKRFRINEIEEQLNEYFQTLFSTNNIECQQIMNESTNNKKDKKQRIGNDNSSKTGVISPHDKPMRKKKNQGRK